MNRYGRIAMDFTRENHPERFAEIEDPEEFFTEAGWEIAGAVDEVLAQLVGEPQAGESLEEYQRRSSRSLSQAEEIVLADHYLLTAPPMSGAGEGEQGEPDSAGDPELEAYYGDLGEVNRAIADLHR
jgi:hypothetical protein